jgi:hypothetical protein
MPELTPVLLVGRAEEGDFLQAKEEARLQTDRHSPVCLARPDV